MTRQPVASRRIVAKIGSSSITDDNGASDIFPTVILEAMASARPVVSTTLAGIPESVLQNFKTSGAPAGVASAECADVSRIWMERWT